MSGRKQIIELAPYSPIELLLLTDRTLGREASEIEKFSQNSVLLSNRLMDRIVPVENHQSMLAFFKKPGWSWDDITPYILVLDQIQDPGNLGTILRSAAATGIFSVITTPGTVSVFNPKALRASAGLLFKIPFLTQISSEEISCHGYNLYAAAAIGGTSAFEAGFQFPLALILGNEGQGLDLEKDWASAELIRIPMADGMNSLNAGVAGSILMYEVYRRFGHVQ